MLLSLLLPSAAAAADGAAQKPPAATLYVFFATWCVPCRVELPHVQRIYETYARHGLRVVLVSEDAPSTAPNIPAFLARAGVTAPWVLDRDSELLMRYHPAASIPFAALVGPEGQLIYAHAGYEPGEELELERAVRAAVVVARPAAPRRGVPVTFSASSQGLGLWRNSRFDPVADGLLLGGIGRLELAARYGVVADARCQQPLGCAEAAARVDGAYISDDVIGSPRDDARLERGSLAWQRGGLRVRAGDSYAALGHGVSLSLRRIDTLGVDTTLRGGRVDAVSDRFRATAVAGLVNPQNIDPVLYRVQPDPGDRMAGAELRYRFDAKSELGPYGLLVSMPGAAPDGGDISWGLAGLSTSLQLLGARWKLDMAAAQRKGLSDPDVIPWALYLSTVFGVGDVTTLVEGKAYRSWRLGRADSTAVYHEPPSLEREDQEVPSNSDALGGRARSEWRLMPELTIYGNALAYLYTLDGSAPLAGSLALHAYAGADVRPNDDLAMEFAGGYRDENNPDMSDRLHLWHLDADASYRATHWLSLSAKLNHRSETKVLVLGPKDFIRGLATLGAAVPGIGAVAFLYGYSTESAQRPVAYPALELRAPLPRGGEARLFAGRLAGGRVCVSGSCRDLPPYEGLRLDLLLRL